MQKKQRAARVKRNVIPGDTRTGIAGKKIEEGDYIILSKKKMVPMPWYLELFYGILWKLSFIEVGVATHDAEAGKKVQYILLNF